MSLKPPNWKKLKEMLHEYEAEKEFVKPEPRMRTYKVKGDRPCQQIIVHESEVINIELNRNWEITEVKFPDIPKGYAVKKLIVTFEVKER